MFLSSLTPITKVQMMVGKRSERERKFVNLEAKNPMSGERKKQIAGIVGSANYTRLRFQEISSQIDKREAETAEMRQLALEKMRSKEGVSESIIEDSKEIKTGTKHHVQFGKFKRALISHFGVKKCRKSGNYKVSNLNLVRYKDLDIPQSTAGDYFRTCFGTKAIFDQLAGDEDWLVSTLIALDKLARPTDLRG